MMQQMLVGLGELEDPVYVDDVFKTKIYSGNSGSQTITNGIDLSGEGGLVWLKARDANNQEHVLYDSERTFNRGLISNTGGRDFDSNPPFSSWNNNGFTLNTSHYATNNSLLDYVSWTFRKQKGFFDVVTYTGDSSSANQTFNHSLDSVPGMVIIKNIERPSTDWYVWVPDSITSLEGTLNTLDDFGSQVIGNVTSTTVQTLYTNQTATNRNGDKYVCYLFGSGDTRFGANRDESIIKVGSYTGTGGSHTVNVGFEPGFLMVKRTNGEGNWQVIDNKRSNNRLHWNDTQRENTESALALASNGFNVSNDGTYTNGSGSTYLYMVIRKGV